MNRSSQLIFTLLLVLFVTASTWGQTEFDVKSAVAQSMAEAGTTDEIAQRLWTACYSHVGSLKPAIDHLSELEKTQPGERDSYRRIRAGLLRIRGDSADARALFESIDSKDRSIEDQLAIAELLDREGSADKAREAYQLLLSEQLTSDLSDLLMLRIALLTKTNKGEKNSALAKYAADESRTDEARNQAALILALRNQSKNAIELFKVADLTKSTARFRELVRLAEWAIEAENLSAAEEWAWGAFVAAKLRRDRRYAGGVLVEAYRRDKALDQLIERFASAKDLSNEGRSIWIDLLRETGRSDDALSLFRTGSSAGFTVEMQRELLEICRETGAESTLTSAYLELIKREPRFIEWREGLSRHYLERGQRDKAIAVWSDYRSVSNEHRYVMAAAMALSNIGLDELAVEFAQSTVDEESMQGEALMFCFQLHRERGRLDAAEACLEELDRIAPADSVARADLADGFDRLGRKKRAVEVLSQLRLARGKASGLDLAMKLAVLLSSVGEEDRALELWHELWRQTTSVPRRRYVEDRLMTVAARLGKLARIAIDLERKLVAGEADALDAGLLVRIYIRVKDPVSASEIIDEHMSRSGVQAADVLQEKARVFLSCDDYFNYEKTVHELIEADPENRGDYLRQLAMSHLERGKRDEARAILEQLKDEKLESISSEFEAGILVMAGLKEEALVAYKKGLARNPERIDSYLLLSNVQRELKRSDRSAGMFQHLAATAEKDDLFTIAIDGLLNMRAGRTPAGAPDKILRWARRTTLERLVKRPTKLYLYRLVADLSDELKDKDGVIEALRAALPISGEQRTPLLRELMTLARGNSQSVGSFRIVNGVLTTMPRGKTNALELMFGRRLLSQGEVVPPQVYLDLGGAFLSGQEVVNARRTFNQASRLPEFAELQPEIARAFEKAEYPSEALRIFERVLLVRSRDIGLILKVAVLQESLGRDDIAAPLYARGLDVYLDQQPLSTSEKEKAETPNPRSLFLIGRNVEEGEVSRSGLTQGFLASANDTEGRIFLARLTERIRVSLGALESIPVEERGDLSSRPRLKAESELKRRVALAFGEIEMQDRVDQRLIHLLPNDKGLMESMCRSRIDAGYLKRCRAFIEASGQPIEVRSKMMLLAGGSSKETDGGLLSPEEIGGLVLPLIAAARNDDVRRLLERVDLRGGEKSDLKAMETLIAAASTVQANELGLGLCRHWFKLQSIHEVGAIYGVVDKLLQTSRHFLNDKQYVSLIRYIVDSVCEEPKKFRAFVGQMPELKKVVGDDLITMEQVERLITGRLGTDGAFTFGIPELISLRPVDERASIVRSIWPLVSKAQRLWFLLDLIESHEEKISPALSDFIVAKIETIDDSNIATRLNYQVRQMAESDGTNVDVSLRIVDSLLKRFPKVQILSSIRPALLLKLGKKEEALNSALVLLPDLLSDDSSKDSFNKGVSLVMETASKLDCDRTLAAIDAVIESTGATRVLLQNRIEVLKLAGRTNEWFDAQRAAVKKLPKEVALWRILRSSLTANANQAEAAEVQARIVELLPKNKAEKSRLHRMHLTLRHPIHALAHYEEPKKAEKIKEEAAATKKPRTVATVKQLKAAVDSERVDDARLLTRRLWRQWPVEGRRVIFFRGSSTFTTLWPLDTKKKVIKKTKPKRPRGGVPALLDSHPKKLRFGAKDEDIDEPNKATPAAKKRRTLEDVLATYEWGREELSRRLRCLSAGQDPSDIFAALVSDIQARGKVEETLSQLRLAQEDGTAGRIEFGLYFALLMSREGEGGNATLQLNELLASSNQEDMGQLRRLANLLAKTGNSASASSLYRWCALRVDVDARRFGGTDRSLLDDAIKNLDGELRDRTVRVILEASRPAPSNVWAENNYHSLCIETYARMLGEKEAIEQCRAHIEAILNPGQSAPRGAAMVACGLLSRQGKYDEAVGCLEMGICSMTPPASLRYPWLRKAFEVPVQTNYRAFNRIFPKGTEDHPLSLEWVKVASRAFSEWDTSGRLNKLTAFPFMAILAQRFHELGDEQAARDMLSRLQERALRNADELLWLADLHRRMGDDAAADAIELELLRSRRLHVERIPEAITRLKASLSAQEAFREAEGAAAYTLHPDLLVLLCELSEETSQPERLAHWKKTQIRATEVLEKFKQDQKASVRK